MDRTDIAGDPRFFDQAGPHSLAAVAAAAQGEIAGPAVDERMLHGVAPLQTAGPQHASYLDNAKYRAALATTTAGAVLVRADLVGAVPPGVAAIVVAEPASAWARVAALFHPPAPAVPGVHPSAVVDPAARLDPSAEIGPLAVIGAGAEIGPRCRIGPGAVIGAGVVLGADCRIDAHASLSHALLGDRVVVYPGARIGQEGFGFVPGGTGFISVPQLGRVVIEHDAEIGANSTIDRGTLRDTVIGAGSRLDNLVQVGHNVRIGRLCVVVAQVGISGSTIVEDHVMIGGQAGLTGHLRIGRGARIAAQSGVMSDLAPGVEVGGAPAQPLRAVFREIALLRRLAREGRTRPAPGSPPPRGEAE
ncbi:MAG TPA: UDP-3-O-(3-hydroxymyristoyl)glucosamine N-acyltransferase [Acetobacteraceae bacterium]|nr:UDP-3-O-(3-hydroxymyristoyl)glucosamine N-acyltransferase [Acetobacteraceae bacterium]